MNIVLEGVIVPSLIAEGDASPHGDGVYLTTLDPSYGMQTILNNNWDGAAVSRENVEAYFEIILPSRKVFRAAEKNRDIQVYKGALRLSDYKWNLKSWDTGDLLATQHFMVSSNGEARRLHGSAMGRYSLVQHIVMNNYPLHRVPVYQQEDGNHYLYTISSGVWCVSPIAGDSVCKLKQELPNEEVAPSPVKNLPWQFSSYDSDSDWGDDFTLKVFPCY